MKAFLLATSAIILATMPSIAFAQSEEPVPAEAEQAGLAEIIVTVQRREESSQRAAIAIDVSRPTRFRMQASLQRRR